LDNSLSVPGGILLLDMVLLPYAPTFWNRIGKTILATILLVSLVAALALAGWKGWKVYQNKFCFLLSFLPFMSVQSPLCIRPARRTDFFFFFFFGPPPSPP
jgi:hypothetical protein